MNKLKIGMMITAISVAAIGIIYIALNSLTFFIYESRSCDWANIDNIEVRTLTNIPKTLSCSCSYSEETDSKTAIFTLDLDSDAILSYAEKNGFKPVISDDEKFTFRNIDQKSFAANLLQKSETHPKRASYKLMLDPSAKKLYVSLQYLK